MPDDYGNFIDKSAKPWNPGACCPRATGPDIVLRLI